MSVETVGLYGMSVCLLVTHAISVFDIGGSGESGGGESAAIDVNAHRQCIGCIPIMASTVVTVINLILVDIKGV